MHNKKATEKKEWVSPALTRLRVSETKSGPSRTTVEDPNYNFYGPVS